MSRVAGSDRRDLPRTAGAAATLRDDKGRELAGLLVDLKERSGRSYERIGARTHLARSTVHRYCTGASVPVTFGPLERIAIACGAGKAELSRLYRVWERARNTTPATKPAAGPEADPAAEPANEPTIGPAANPTAGSVTRPAVEPPVDPLTEPLLDVATLIEPVGPSPPRRSRRFRWTLGVFTGALVVIAIVAVAVFILPR